MGNVDRCICNKHDREAVLCTRLHQRGSSQCLPNFSPFSALSLPYFDDWCNSM